MSHSRLCFESCGRLINHQRVYLSCYFTDYLMLGIIIDRGSFLNGRNKSALSKLFMLISTVDVKRA